MTIQKRRRRRGENNTTNTCMRNVVADQSVMTHKI